MMNVETPQPGVPIFVHAASMPEPKQWMPNVALWQPLNLEGVGSACLVTQEDASQMYIAKSSTWVANAICRYYNIDFKELRYKYLMYLNLYQWVPIYLPVRNVVLLAVKTRVPSTHNEYASGYIANTAIDKMETIDAGVTRIHMSTGQYIDVLMSQKSLRHRQHLAEWFAYVLHRDGIM